MGSSANYSLPIGFVLQGQVYTYTIEKVLGQGSFGITYLASTVIQGPLGDVTVQVAVKEFFAKELDSRWSGGLVATRKEGSFAYKYAKAFQRESRNLSRMKHPGIVRVLEAFDANGTHYYSMEYLSGGSLDDKVKGIGITEAEALPLVRKIGEALSYMHARKIMHLDLKPKNIMLKGNGSPVIIDFGLSKQYDEEGEPESSTTIGLGTPGYAPIEQATQTTSGEFQPTLDIYALGATLFKMLTGKTPPTATLVLNKKATLAPDLQEKNVSSGTVDAILKAMAPLMDDRPQRVEDFLSMLEAEDETMPMIKPEVKPVPKPAPAPAPAPVPTPTGGKPKTWLWVLLGGLAALALILAFVFGRKGGNQGAGGDSGADTLAVVPVDSAVETPVSSPVNDPAPETPVAPSVNDPVPEAPGSIKITCEPAGASIWLDGKDTKKKTPAVIKDVRPGEHEVFVVKGREFLFRTVNVHSGKSILVNRNEQDLGGVSRNYNEEDFLSSIIVDFGLPSGTVWHFDPFRLDVFGAFYHTGWHLPTKTQLEELKNVCAWSFDGGYVTVTGPNGESIKLFNPYEGHTVIISSSFFSDKVWGLEFEPSGDEMKVSMFPFDNDIHFDEYCQVLD